jgi:hypothetical protein
MKEYIVLLFIAMVGIFGLFTIHHEVKLSQQSTLGYVSGETLRAVPVTLQMPRESLSMLESEPAAVEELVTLKIINFDPNSTYVLDAGNGKKTKVAGPECLVQYDCPGNFLVTLLKNSILVDAIEVKIGDQAATDKLVRF